MFNLRRRTLVAALVALVALPLTAHAGSERYVSITSLPYTISTPGCYRLVGNLTFANIGAAITINCDNVVLDLDGFTILDGQSYVGATYAVAAVSHSNVTIRNGRLRSFWVGIHMGDGAGLVVEDMTLIESRSSAILIENAHGAIVRRCNVADTGWPSSTTFPNIGIKVSGKNASVHDNVVTRTKTNTSGTPSAGISVAGCDHAVVERNTIANEDYYVLNTSTVGIDAGGNLVVVAGNRIAKMYTGISYGTAGSGPYLDNVVLWCSTPYSGGTDAGGNH